MTDAKLRMSCRNLCKKSEIITSSMWLHTIFSQIQDNSNYITTPLSQSSVVWKIPLQNMFNFLYDYKATCSFSVDEFGKDSFQPRTFSSKFNRALWLRRWKQAMETVTCQGIHGRAQTVTFMMPHLMFTKCLTNISSYYYLSILL